MATLDELTVMLRMVDDTRRATDSASQNIRQVTTLTEKLKGVGKAAGAALGAASAAAITNGSQTTTELASMARQVDLSFTETQALYNAVRNADASTNLDNLTEAMLTLKERTADALTGAGPLFDMMNEFSSFKFDLQLDDGRKQLADFLEVVGQLPSANTRIFALKEVIGDEDARPFFNVINNTEKLSTLLKELRKDAEDVNDVLDLTSQIDNEASKMAVNDLSFAWERFSVAMYTLVAPALTVITKAITWIVEVATDATQKLDDLFTTFKGWGDSAADSMWRVFNNGSKMDSPVELTDRTQAYVDGLKKMQENMPVPDINTSLIINEFGTFANLQAFEKWQKDQRALQKEAMKKIVVVDPIKVTNTHVDDAKEFDFLNGLDRAANDSQVNQDGFNVNSEYLSESEIRQQQIEREIAMLGDLTSAFSGAGLAFGGFAQLAEQNGSKTFKTFQRLQIAVGVVAGISAQLQALADPSVTTFVQKFAIYAKIAGIVASGIASMKAVSMGSSSSPSAGSASVGGGVSTAQGGATSTVEQRPQRNVTVNIQGNGNYSPEQLVEFVDALNDNDLGVYINANRVAA